MTIKEAINWFEIKLAVNEAMGLVGPQNDAARLALDALRAQQQERSDSEPDVEEYEEMTIEAAIKHCEAVSRRSPCTPCEREHMRLSAWLTELVSLRAQQKPNEPLTLEELRQMDGDPVWVEFVGRPDGSITSPLWMLVNVSRKQIVTDVEYVDWSDEGWFAYRRKPESEAINHE